MKKIFNNMKIKAVIVALIAVGLPLAMKNNSFASTNTPCTTHSFTYSEQWVADQDVPMSCHQCQDDEPGTILYDSNGNIIGMQYTVSAVTQNITAHNCSYVYAHHGGGCTEKTFEGGYDGECPGYDIVIYE
ncbi:MAG: hypothetical protein V4553_16195 [Bacteroidota bacterium]